MRLFLAIDIPAAMRDLLRRLQERLKGECSGWRWVRPEAIHLTIRFLGEVGEELDASSRQAWRAAAAPVAPFGIRLSAIGRFPEEGRPRVLWVGMNEIGEGGGLRTLADRVERSARDLGFEPERRPFRPHLTLARAERGRRPRWLEGLEMELGEETLVDRLVLFRSQLHPAGARYTALEHFLLEGPHG